MPIPRARGIQVAYTLASLLDAGHEVRLAYTPKDAAPAPLPAYELHPRGELQNLALSRRPPAPLGLLPLRSNLFYNRRLLSWLKRARASGDAPNVIMTRHLKTAYALLRANTGIPVVYEAHEVFALSAKPKHRAEFARMETYVLRHAARAIAISRTLGNALSEHYGIQREFDILHSGVSLPEAPPPAKPWSECSQHIIYTGSLFGWKGVKDLVEAARWLPGYRITIIGGSANEIAGLRTSAPARGAQLVFRPQMPHTHIQSELNGACIAVLPNRAESISAWTSPIKLFEYMGAGCAIVASDLPAIREILTPDEAMLVPAQTPLALAEAIRALANAPASTAAQGTHLRERAAEFTWQARGRKLSEILRRAAQTR